MKYEAEIDGQPLIIEFDQRDGRVSATIDGRAYDVEVLRPEDGVYLILAGEHVYEARVSPDTSGKFNVRIRDRVFSARLIDRKHRRHGEEHSQEGPQQLIAPMPGKVVRVLLQEGDEVEAGQGVVIVEAMKMQNEIKSSKKGRVLEVRVSEGETVNANHVLAVVG
jgi:biotin carboxyl carrier protein